MIISVNGNLGAGKTHSAIELACELADDEDKVIVTNVQLDLDGMHEYCLMKGYRRLAQKVRRGQVFYTRNVLKMLSYQNSVVLLDEAGVFLAVKMMMGRNYFMFQPLIADLLQSRKAGTHLIWIAQEHSHVASEIRDVTNFYFHVVNIFNKWKFRTMFSGYSYTQWLYNRTVQKWFKNMITFKVYKFDTHLFKWYGTLDRLDGKKTNDPRQFMPAVELLDTHEEDTENPVFVPTRDGWRLEPGVKLKGPAVKRGDVGKMPGMFILPGAYDQPGAAAPGRRQGRRQGQQPAPAPVTNIDEARK